MATLNLENDNVFQHELSLADARELSEAVLEEIETVIDNAQAHVFTEKDTEAYVVIKISKEGA